jgi:MoaA/NifB/PqqE/SkfB family radical SAM enzyme
MLNKEMVSRMAGYKNLTPALSVEGMKEETDRRRGNGTFDKILKSMEAIRGAGVPFGISVTAGSSNLPEVLSNEFLDFFFKTQGAFYCFYFQYLPLGRNSDFGRMPSPGQRLEFWKNLWEVIERKKLFLIDFWNHGPLVKGCISAGRDGGYFYIDWNGNIMPCVFAPYSAGNIIELYKTGRSLENIWDSGFFKSIRKWQAEKGHGTCSPKESGNLLTPCPYRDHYPQFMTWVDQSCCDAEDISAKQAMDDPLYRQKMTEYGRDIKKVFDPVWQDEYMKNQ